MPIQKFVLIILLLILGITIQQPILASWTLDFTNPTCWITFSPTSPQLPGKTITVTAWGQDNYQTSLITLWNYNGNVVGTSPGGAPSYSWNTTGLSPQTYTFSGEIIDSAGNKNTCNATFTVLGSCTPNISTKYTCLTGPINYDSRDPNMINVSWEGCPDITNAYLDVSLNNFKTDPYTNYYSKLVNNTNSISLLGWYSYFIYDWYNLRWQQESSVRNLTISPDANYFVRIKSGGMAYEPTSFSLPKCTNNPPPNPPQISPLTCSPTYGYTATISWTNNNITWVDISNFPEPNQENSYSHKDVSKEVNLSTQAPAGFNPYINAGIGANPTEFNTYTTYYARVFDGARNSTWTPFQRSVCPTATPTPSPTPTSTPTPTLTPTPGAWMRTSGGDVHSNR